MNRRETTLGGLTRRKIVRLAAGLPVLAGLTKVHAAQKGTAEFRNQGSTLSLENTHLAISWRLSDGHMTAVELTDRHVNQKIALDPDLFQLELVGGKILRSSEMAMTEKPKSARAAGAPKSI